MDPADLAPEAFDDLVRDSLAQLPDEAAALVAEVAIVARDEPEPGEVAPGTLRSQLRAYGWASIELVR